MKLFIVLSFGLTLAIAGNEVKQRSNGDHQMERKIFEGSKANLGEFPYQAGIWNVIANERRFCGGSILNNRWILTAGHCVYKASNFKVFVGGTHAFEVQSTMQVFNVIESFLHPNYSIPGCLNNDVALLKLGGDIVYNQYVKPIRISNANDYLTENVPLRVSGWGASSKCPTSPNPYLKYAEVISITNDQCKEYFAEYAVLNSVVCTKGLTGWPCIGDSGGALIKIDSHGIPIQVGVVSFVHNCSCVEQYPTGYSRIPDFLPFIQKYVNVITN